MRLFIAINFSPETKEKLLATQSLLKIHTQRGSFTHPENLHLTLVFLGEVPDARVRALRQIMDSVTSAPFELNMNGIGRFKRDGGDIWWVGVELCESLQTLYDQLYEGVTQNGFAVEKRKYTPHLTLAREVNLQPDADPAQLSAHAAAFTEHVNKISLMKSERICGKLTYTEIHSKTLQ